MTQTPYKAEVSKKRICQQEKIERMSELDETLLLLSENLKVISLDEANNAINDLQDRYGSRKEELVMSLMSSNIIFVETQLIISEIPELQLDAILTLFYFFCQTVSSFDLLQFSGTEIFSRLAFLVESTDEIIRSLSCGTLGLFALASKEAQASILNILPLDSIISLLSSLEPQWDPTSLLHLLRDILFHSVPVESATQICAFLLQNMLSMPIDAQLLSVHCLYFIVSDKQNAFLLAEIAESSIPLQYPELLKAANSELRKILSSLAILMIKFNGNYLITIELAVKLIESSSEEEKKMALDILTAAADRSCEGFVSHVDMVKLANSLKSIFNRSSQSVKVKVAAVCSCIIVRGSTELRDLFVKVGFPFLLTKILPSVIAEDQRDIAIAIAVLTQTNLSEDAKKLFTTFMDSVEVYEIFDELSESMDSATSSAASLVLSGFSLEEET